MPRKRGGKFCFQQMTKKVESPAESSAAEANAVEPTAAEETAADPSPGSTTSVSCSLCSAEFSSQQYLQAHEKYTHEICNICDTSVNNLEVHSKLAHYSVALSTDVWVALKFYSSIPSELLPYEKRKLTDLFKTVITVNLANIDIDRVVPVAADVITDRLHQVSIKCKTSFSRILVPPTKDCLHCDRRLTLANPPIHVILFDECGPIVALKYTYRDCPVFKGYVIYTLDKYSSSESGLSFYNHPVNIVKSTNRTYFSRSQVCSFTRTFFHCWASFSGIQVEGLDIFKINKTFFCVLSDSIVIGSDGNLVENHNFIFSTEVVNKFNRKQNNKLNMLVPINLAPISVEESKNQFEKVFDVGPEGKGAESFKLLLAAYQAQLASPVVKKVHNLDHTPLICLYGEHGAAKTTSNEICMWAYSDQQLQFNAATPPATLELLSTSTTFSLYLDDLNNLAKEEKLTAPFYDEKGIATQMGGFSKPKAKLVWSTNEGGKRTRKVAGRCGMFRLLGWMQDIDTPTRIAKLTALKDLLASEKRPLQFTLSLCQVAATEHFADIYAQQLQFIDEAFPPGLDPREKNLWGQLFAWFEVYAELWPMYFDRMRFRAYLLQIVVPDIQKWNPGVAGPLTLDEFLRAGIQELMSDPKTYYKLLRSVRRSKKRYYISRTSFPVIQSMSIVNFDDDIAKMGGKVNSTQKLLRTDCIDVSLIITTTNPGCNAGSHRTNELLVSTLETETCHFIDAALQGHEAWTEVKNEMLDSEEDSDDTAGRASETDSGEEAEDASESGDPDYINIEALTSQLSEIKSANNSEDEDTQASPEHRTEDPTPDAIPEVPTRKAMPEAANRNAVPQAPIRGALSTPMRRTMSEGTTGKDIFRAAMWSPEAILLDAMPKAPTRDPMAEVPTRKAMAEVPTRKAMAEVPTRKVMAEVPTRKAMAEVPTRKLMVEVPTPKAMPEVQTEKAMPEVLTQEGMAKAPTGKVTPEAPSNQAVSEVPIQNASSKARLRDMKQTGSQSPSASGRNKKTRKCSAVAEVPSSPVTLKTAKNASQPDGKAQNSEGKVLESKRKPKRRSLTTVGTESLKRKTETDDSKLSRKRSMSTDGTILRKREPRRSERNK